MTTRLELQEHMNKRGKKQKKEKKKSETDNITICDS